MTLACSKNGWVWDHFILHPRAKLCVLFVTIPRQYWNTLTFADSRILSSTEYTYQVSPLAKSNDYHLSKTQRFIRFSKTVVHSYIRDTTYARDTQEMAENPFRTLDPWQHELARPQFVERKKATRYGGHMWLYWISSRRQPNRCSLQDGGWANSYQILTTKLNLLRNYFNTLYHASFIILYYDQQMHSYFTNYHTPTCFDNIMSSSGSL